MNILSKSNKYKIKSSLLEKAFAEIMPEVKFIDCTPIGRSVVSKKNFLKNPENKKRLK